MKVNRVSANEPALEDLLGNAFVFSPSLRSENRRLILLRYRIKPVERTNRSGRKVISANNVSGYQRVEEKELPGTYQSGSRPCAAGRPPISGSSGRGARRCASSPRRASSSTPRASSISAAPDRAPVSARPTAECPPS